MKFVKSGTKRCERATQWWGEVPAPLLLPLPLPVPADLISLSCPPVCNPAFWHTKRPLFCKHSIMWDAPSLRPLVFFFPDLRPFFFMTLPMVRSCTLRREVIQRLCFLLRAAERGEGWRGVAGLLAEPQSPHYSERRRGGLA